MATYETLIAEAANHWPLQDLLGTNENGTDATPAGNITLVSGPGYGYDNANQFDGTGDWYDCGDRVVGAAGSGNASTHACWIKIASTSSNGWILGEGNSTQTGTLIAIDYDRDNNSGTNDLSSRHREGRIGFSGSLVNVDKTDMTVDEWYYVAMTLSTDGNLGLYVVPAGGSIENLGTTAVGRIGTPLDQNVMTIGALGRSGTVSDPIEADIAGVASWSRELLSSEIELLAAGPIVVADPVDPNLSENIVSGSIRQNNGGSVIYAGGRSILNRKAPVHQKVMTDPDLTVQSKTIRQ